MEIVLIIALVAVIAGGLYAWAVFEAEVSFERERVD